MNIQIPKYYETYDLILDFGQLVPERMNLIIGRGW